MRVYKATDADMSCHMGSGTFQYRLGVTASAEKSQCGQTGLHACEYVLDCLRYYSLGGGHRFFEAEAGGDIAEDGDNTRIACTFLTLERELTNRDIARAAVRYMLLHPKRGGWEYTGTGVCVAADCAEVYIPDGIAVARGKNPRARGCTGAHLGFVREDAYGEILAAWILTVDGSILPDTWYTIESAREAVRRAGIR